MSYNIYWATNHTISNNLILIRYFLMTLFNYSWIIHNFFHIIVKSSFITRNFYHDTFVVKIITQLLCMLYNIFMTIYIKQVSWYISNRYQIFCILFYVSNKILQNFYHDIFYICIMIYSILIRYIFNFFRDTFCIYDVFMIYSWYTYDVFNKIFIKFFFHDIFKFLSWYIFNFLCISNLNFPWDYI